MFNFDYTDKKSKENFIAEYSKNNFSDEIISVKEYQNAIIYPNINMNGGVYENEKFVFNTSLHRNWIQNFPKEVTAVKND